MDNDGMQIWEPARGILHDTDSNLNEIHLNEPFEVYASPVFPNAFSGRVSDPVNHFRKVVLYQDFPQILDYFVVESSGDVKLRKHKGGSNERFKDFKKKMKHVLHTFASKEKVKEYMDEITSYGIVMTPSQFYKKIYKKIRKAIKSKRTKLFTHH